MVDENPKEKPKKEKKYVIQVCQELIDIFEIIRQNVAYNTWGTDEKYSYYKCSKILANRVKKAKVY